MCPTTLARFAAVLNQLGSDAWQVQVLFVKLDPERDTPEKLTVYMPWFDPSFIGLYSDQASTEHAAREFKVFFSIVRVMPRRAT